jgi:hypothetical protein
VPVEWEIRGAALVLVFSGIVERPEIEAALAAALADTRAGSRMGLLWDGRASQTPLSADDLGWRFELVSALAARGRVGRAAVLVTDTWRATLDYFHGEAARLAPGLPLEMFVDEAEALAWLARAGD